MEYLLGANSGRGRDGGRKKVILLTATPINNDLFDLYNQLSLITRGDRSYFKACGIGDLYRYFVMARRDSRQGNGVFALFNLLEEIVIRRTRPFIRKAYPNAVLRKREPDGTWVEQLVRFPERRLRTVNYNLEATYAGIYDEIVSGIDSLKLAPYNLESYKKAGVEIDEFEAGREQALVGIFKSRYLKRFESSIDAFRISIRRALAFLKTFESYILDGRILKSSDFHKALRFLAREDEEDDATPASMADEMDASEEARRILDELQRIDPYYRDTARYLYRHLGHPDNPDAVAFCQGIGDVTVRRMDSGAEPKERTRIIQRFAPKANGQLDWIGTDQEIDILISTDVLSEGQNLQDCGHLVNYDLHWNPTRMVQRAGRIDRIGTDFDTLWIYNMFPDQGLERLLGLVESLSRKIADIDQAGFLDASVLGETVHPRDFNTLRRIRDEDGSVIEEEEQFTELASNEFLVQQLRSLLDAGGRDMLESLPDGIHSGLAKAVTKGVFFYFQGRATEGRKLHFWKYLDLKDQRIIDNRYMITNLIACDQDTPRVIDPEIFGAVFDIQERVVEDILRSVEEQRALEVAPRSVDPIQQTLATVIQGYMNHPDIERPRAIEVIRFLSQPMLAVQVRELRQAYRDFQRRAEVKTLLGKVDDLRSKVGAPQAHHQSPDSWPVNQLSQEDLRLICFDFITGG